jgi:hypothetical protein
MNECDTTFKKEREKPRLPVPLYSKIQILPKHSNFIYKKRVGNKVRGTTYALALLAKKKKKKTYALALWGN